MLYVDDVYHAGFLWGLFTILDHCGFLTEILHHVLNAQLVAPPRGVML